MPTASARPPKVMILIVWPRAERQISDVVMASGMETATISVGRQLPRKSRIMAAVSAAAMSPSRTTPLIAELTKTDWSDTGLTVRALGKPAAICGSIALT